MAAPAKATPPDAVKLSIILSTALPFVRAPPEAMKLLPELATVAVPFAVTPPDAVTLYVLPPPPVDSLTAKCTAAV